MVESVACCSCPHQTGHLVVYALARTNSPEERIPSREVDERPTCGYRRITALLNWQTNAAGEPWINHK